MLQKFGTVGRREGQEHGDADQPHGARIIAQLDALEDRQRQRLVRNTCHSLAPRVRATVSRRAGTPSNARRAVRVSNGSDMTAIASTTARHVNTMSVPVASCIQPPSAPRRPTRCNSTSPVATGGSTIGSVRSDSMKVLPANSRRANSQASAMPGTSRSTVAPSAVSRLNVTMRHSSGESAVTR